MKTMGHRDVKTAMHYQHPEVEVVRAALDYLAPTNTAETRGEMETPYGTLHVTPENHHPWEVVENLSLLKLSNADGDYRPICRSSCRTDQPERRASAS